MAEILNWGFKVKQLRESKHLTQDELSVKSGLKRSHISVIELGSIKTAQKDVVDKLAKGFGMAPDDLFKYIHGIDTPKTSATIWDKHAARQPLKISVYPDYLKVHAGEPTDVIDYIYMDQPERASYNIRAYRVEGDCMEPYLHNGEYVIVDHDMAIENGDRVVAICNNQLHVAKLKMIGGEYFLENRYATYKMTDCQGIAKVVGHFGK